MVQMHLNESDDDNGRADGLTRLQSVTFKVTGFIAWEG